MNILWFLLTDSESNMSSRRRQQSLSEGSSDKESV